MATSKLYSILVPYYILVVPKRCIETCIPSLEYQVAVFTEVFRNIVGYILCSKHLCYFKVTVLEN